MCAYLSTAASFFFFWEEKIYIILLVQPHNKGALLSSREADKEPEPDIHIPTVGHALRCSLHLDGHMEIHSSVRAFI
jgi:hypothetical protein